MAKQYKVWIEIEEYDTETERGTTLDAPGADVATFDTYDYAYSFASTLQGLGGVIAGDYVQAEEDRGEA